MAATPVLTLALLFAEQQGIPVPSTLIGSTDKQTRQLRSIISELILELSDYRWENQRIRREWNSAAGNYQGKLTEIFGEQYLSIVPDSMWNVTRRMRIYGPLSDQIWQALQVLPNAGPEFQSWVSEGALYVSPALPGAPFVPDTLSAVYVTKATVANVNAPFGPTTYGAFITGDGDYFFWPDRVFLVGLRYRWKKQKGEAGWEDDYNEMMSLIAKYTMKDGAAKISMSPNNHGPRPGIVIPAGSWNV